MRKTLWALLIVALLCLPAAALAESKESLVFNGDFSLYSEQQDLPAGWYYNAWVIEDSDYYTEQTEQGETVVVLHNLRENDARVCQRIAVSPSTAYRFSCDVFINSEMTEPGASISILNTFSGSSPLRRTDGWQQMEFIGVAGINQTEIILALRIGNYGALSRGEARFKNVRMETLAIPPKDAQSLEPYTGGGTAAAHSAPNWPGIVLCTLLCALLCIGVYSKGIMRPARLDAKTDKTQVIILALLALLMRVICSAIFVGHSTDLNCFIAWSEAMAEHGPGGFYTSGMFADYPPGYMYVLWGIGWLRRLFGLDYGGGLFILLLKLPSIAADIASATIVYLLAKKQNMAEQKALLLFGVVALSPVAAFISGGWGQIDSLYTLLLLGVCWLLFNQKLIATGVVYGLAILMKPQALMAGPLLAVAYLLPQPGQPYGKRLKQTLLAVLSAIAVIFLLSLPFGGGQESGWLLEKYFSTATSYPYASIEAFNLFSLWGGNWASIETVPLLFSYGVWGVLFITLSIAGAFWLYYQAHKKQQKGALFLMLAYLLTALFTLGPYMHERYLFPALLLLVAATIYYDDKRLIGCALYFSITLLFNALCAFYIVDFQEARDSLYDALVLLGSTATVLGFAYFTYVCYDIAVRGRLLPTSLFAAPEKAQESEPLREQEEAHAPIQLVPYDRALHFTKKDWLFCGVLTAVYAMIALFGLGTLSAPETEYISKLPGEAVSFNFNQQVELSEYWVFGGIAEGSLLMQTGEGEESSFEQSFDDMFRWKRVPFNYAASSVTLMTYAGELRLREIAFFDTDGKMVLPVPENEAAALLLDEQVTVPSRPSYLNGMYFDELYHARTAYEHLHGLDPYENSHPPLGKVFIMLGIAVFGMNPFGWRVVGALFGIAMVPILYAFGKRLFHKPEYALLTAFLFAFDFMHFTQTRIATIDVYAVFFILLMYYYMYQYTCMSFFTDGLRATLTPLGLAGLFFGLGAASKWIAIYAGVGLALLLALSLCKRYREYRQAMQSEEEAMRRHVQDFWKNTWHTLAWCCLFYIAVPVVIYLFSYMPYYFCEMNYSFSDIWGYQKFMWSYHSGLNATHPFQSSWWQWPFTQRPMWYYSGDSEPAGMLSTLTASGNPAVWWVCTVASLALALQRLLQRTKSEPGITMAFVGVLANFLPWVLVTRCTFIYHFFATVPFIILCGVYLLKQCEERNPRLSWVKWVWMGVCIALFLLLYPGLSGHPISITYAQILQYLPGGNLLYGA